MLDMELLSSRWLSATRPIRSGGGIIYDMDCEQDRQRLASDIWTEPFTDSLVQLREENPELVKVLASSIVNQSKATPLFMENKERLIDGMLVNICRAHALRRAPQFSNFTGHSSLSK